MSCQNGKIYKILNDRDDDVYVGSTCVPLSRRMAKHRWCLKSSVSCNRPLYVKMKELGVDNFYIELLEEYPCDNKEQLNAREGYYIRSMATLNIVIAGRSQQEYQADNKDKLSDYNKKYQETNKEQIHETKQKYHDEHKEEINMKCKKYREEHKEELNQKQKQYRQANKETLNKRFECLVCGGSYLPRHKRVHEQTNKHKEAVLCETC